MIVSTSFKPGQACSIVQSHSITGNVHDAVSDLHGHYASAKNLTLLHTEFQMEVSTIRPILAVHTNFYKIPMKSTKMWKILRSL